MRLESHLEAFAEHKDTIFRWSLEVRGIAKSQRVIGLHASRGAIELLAAYLHEQGLISVGAQLNHRWFKSPHVAARIPDFPRKGEVVAKLVDLENACEDLAYGAPADINVIQRAVQLFREIEQELQALRAGHA
ncbi:hypothetical protein HY642_06315 [Candidatus Woesearchaeota archaeon]|nr:hypothetical protein [Candidatus Woesearchaeota archaeon]